MCSEVCVCHSSSILLPLCPALTPGSCILGTSHLPVGGHPAGGDRGQGIMVCIPTLPGCRLAVAFSVEVQSSPIAIASALAKLPLRSGFWPCPFGHGDGPSGTILCWLPLNMPSYVTAASSSLPPGSLSECAILVVVWGIQVRRAPIWRSQDLGYSEALSQVTV